jgi:hypothetical protein
LAAARPAAAAPYVVEGPLPEGFAGFLAARGCEAAAARLRCGGRELARDEGERLLSEFLAARARPSGPRRDEERQRREEGVARALGGGLAALDARAAFDGAAPAPDGGAPAVDAGLEKAPAAKKPPERRGLRVLGIELGGRDQSRPEGEEPYLSKGAERFLDWDLRLRLPLDGVGLRAVYRHPQVVRAFSLSALKYWDWLGTLAGRARDGLYDDFGLTPETDLGGFQVGAAVVLDPHWGLNAGFDDRAARTPERWRHRRAATVGAGWSPLGDNPGKHWNYTLVGAASFERLERRYAVLEDDRSGVGGSASLVFQRALSSVPLDVLRPLPLVGGGLTRLDRLRATTTASVSELSTLALRQAVEVSIDLGAHLELTPGIWAQVRPDPADDPDEKPFAYGAIFGLDLQNLGF